MIRFDFDRLSPGMRFALSWLIDQGGAMRFITLLDKIKDFAREDGRLVTRNTVNSLINRGHLEESDDALQVVQVSDWALSFIYRNPDNPNPLPIMRARAEALARRESAARTADMIQHTWNNRNNTTTESD